MLKSLRWKLLFPFIRMWNSWQHICITYDIHFLLTLYVTFVFYILTVFKHIYKGPPCWAELSSHIWLLDLLQLHGGGVRAAGGLSLLPWHGLRAPASGGEDMQRGRQLVGPPTHKHVRRNNRSVQRIFTKLLYTTSITIISNPSPTTLHKLLFILYIYCVDILYTLYINYFIWIK